MLTPEQLEHLPDNLVRLYAQLEEDIIADMAVRINAMDLYIPAVDWQFQKAKEMGNSYDAILKRLSAATGKTKQELTELMTAAASESMKEEDAIHKKAGKAFQPLNQSAALLATLNAGMKVTAGYFENLCRTTANNGSRQFSDVLDRAYMKVISGAFSRDEVIKSAVKELASQGITAAVYKNGRRMSLESAVRMNVVTGINQTCAELQLQRANEVGCDLVAVSAHAGARPSHAYWQGRVYSRSGTHPKYPDFESSTGYGTVTGLCGANCRHTFYSFYEGISKTVYTKKELDEMNQKKITYNGQKLTEYEASQIQRKMERNIRRWKREKAAMRAAGQDTAEATAKLKFWRREMDSFIRQTGFKRQYNREEIFTRAKAAETLNGNVKYLDTIDLKDTNVVQSTLEKYEKQIVLQNFESAVVIKPDGKVYRVDGDRAMVEPRDAGQLRDAIVTHNHPADETEYSFSKEDIELFIGENLAVLRGVDEKYIYEVRRSGILAPALPVKTIFEMTEEDHLHYMVDKLMREAGIYYERKRRNHENS